MRRAVTRVFAGFSSTISFLQAPVFEVIDKHPAVFSSSRTLNEMALSAELGHPKSCHPEAQRCVQDNRRLSGSRRIQLSRARGALH